MTKMYAGRAVRKPDVHRLLAAMGRRNLKGMSVATAESGRHYSRHSVSVCDNADS